MLRYCFCFLFWFFGLEACRILAPQPGSPATGPALEGEVLTIGPPGKSLLSFFFLEENNFIDDVYCAMKFLYSIYPSSNEVHLDGGKPHSRWPELGGLPLLCACLCLFRSLISSWVSTLLPSAGMTVLKFLPGIMASLTLTSSA